ncbi:hypothetical protein [Pseudomonas sessilinigenes]|uniref:Uncharacterized protein n=1 Tax=Pseudomonas sessilinigenes TaxID=658629 RepID=A0ABX8MSI0_9PSED|nr:hypothetical protein [Pseudomonas sessilinigenes]AZC23229.1 hypothetical protein C4K39_1538 [Pseudomonas sessilinigenes]QXH42244.1 hypothetical protein KSS89_08495 [Pseudomonas sessilinigenes]
MTTTKKPAEQIGWEPAAPGTSVFRDTLYTSRVLILPDGRQLAVKRGQVTAEAGDQVALDYLRSHPDLQPQG